MSPTSALLVAAVLTQGAIAFALLMVLGAIRLPLVGSGRVRMADIALSREPWPVHEKRVSNAFDNQFQMPVLFYVAAGLALYIGPGWPEIVLAWIFVLSRIAHATVFAVDNNVPRRFLAYVVGCTALGLLWLDLTVRLIELVT